MDSAERDRFISEPHTAVIATVDERGDPHGVPVWYRYVNGTFRIITGRESAKVRNLRAKPRAALVIDQRDGSFRHLTCLGDVTIDENCSYEERFALYEHYRGREEAKKVADRGGHEEMVVLVLHPERWY